MLSPHATKTLMVDRFRNTNITKAAEHINVELGTATMLRSLRQLCQCKQMEASKSTSKNQDEGAGCGTCEQPDQR